MRFDGFHHLLSYWADQTPDAPALVYGTAKTVCSYRALFDTVLRRTDELQRSEKTCIGIFCDGSFDCVVTILAASIAGLQVVLFDENTPDAQIPGLMAYTDVDCLWCDEDLKEELTPHLTPGASDGWGKLLFFTSGTTDRAKAVVLTEKSLCASAWNGSAMLPLRQDDRLLCMLPLNHVFGFVCGLLWGLSCGACVALGRGARHYFDDLQHFCPTAVSVVPLLLGFLLKNNCINDKLRLVLVGAGDCPPQLLALAAGRGLQVSFGYGLTETSSGVAISVSGDPYAMEVCPDDHITIADDGEILVAAPTCIMQGYYKMEEAFAAVVKAGVLHTGDLGHFDADGKLHITGRKKEMLVLQDGTKLFLPEYERELAGALGTQELAVILKNGQPVLVLQGDDSRRSAVVEQLKPLMALRPRGQQLREILFVQDPLPRTATGKIQRWELQQKVEKE